MKTEWLSKSDSSNLILFFNGWGMDARPVKHMRTEHADSLMFYDYRDMKLSVSLKTTFNSYESVSLIAWSLGVAVADLVCRNDDLKFKTATAINGTPYPAHDDYGIPEAVFDGTIESLSEINLVKFYRRMCTTPEVLKYFMNNAPSPPIGDLADELRALRRMTAADKTIFQKAMISTDDRIVPPGNQLRCWNKLGVPATERPGPHFLFCNYSSWEDLLDA